MEDATFETVRPIINSPSGLSKSPNELSDDASGE
jgi:hypothetical protein